MLVWHWHFENEAFWDCDFLEKNNSLIFILRQIVVLQMRHDVLGCWPPNSRYYVNRHFTVVLGVIFLMWGIELMPDECWQSIGSCLAYSRDLGCFCILFQCVHRLYKLFYDRSGWLRVVHLFIQIMLWLTFVKKIIIVDWQKHVSFRQRVERSSKKGKHF